MSSGLYQTLGRQHLQLLISAVCGPGRGETGRGRESELLWFREAQSPQAIVSKVTSVPPWPLQRVVSVSHLSLIDDTVLQAPRKSPSSSRGPLLRQPGVWPLAQSHRHNRFSRTVALARCCHAPACLLPLPAQHHPPRPHPGDPSTRHAPQSQPGITLVGLEAVFLSP